MKKTLFFLMSVCASFLSVVSCVGQSEVSKKNKQQQDMSYKYLATTAMANFIGTCKKTVVIKDALKSCQQHQHRLASPTAIARNLSNEDDSHPTVPKRAQRQLSSSKKEDGTTSLLRLAHPSTTQSEQELASLPHYLSSCMIRVHSSQYENLCDHPTPDLKTPVDHITPDLGKTPDKDVLVRSRSNSYSIERTRSNSSDYFWGSLSGSSCDSPQKMKQRQDEGTFLHKLHKTPELGEASPKTESK